MSHVKIGRELASVSRWQILLKTRKMSYPANNWEFWKSADRLFPRCADFRPGAENRSVTWKWVCLGRFLDGFQNLAINQEKSFSFWIEYKWHRIQHYSVPVGNILFFRAIYSVAKSEKRSVIIGRQLTSTRHSKEICRFDAVKNPLALPRLHILGGKCC